MQSFRRGSHPVRHATWIDSGLTAVGIEQEQTEITKNFSLFPQFAPVKIPADASTIPKSCGTDGNDYRCGH